MKTAIIGIALVVLGAVSPPLASADQNDFLQDIQKNYPYVYAQHDRQALVNEGLKVCDLERKGVEGMDETEIVQRDLPMSYSAAAYIVMIAGADLGC